MAGGKSLFGEDIISMEVDMLIYVHKIQNWVSSPFNQRTHLVDSHIERKMPALAPKYIFVWDSSHIEPHHLQVFDSGLNIWYTSHDLPEDDMEGLNQILNWNDDLLWINWAKIWKFEIDTWSLLREIGTHDLWHFAFPVPNDFVPDCAIEK